MKKILISIVILFSLSACSDTPEEKVVKNKERESTLASMLKENNESFQHPQLVGKTLNGNEVTMVAIQYLCATCYDKRYMTTHYVYMVNGVTSENYQVPSGKTTRTQVDVVLREGATAMEVINEADRLKKVMDEQERAEYERLKKKYDH